MTRKNLKILFLIIIVILIQVVSLFPIFIETYYSKLIFPKIGVFSRIILGKIPFSFGDVLYVALICYLIFLLFKNKLTISKKPFLFIKVATFSSIVFYITFQLLWGINYHRVPLKEKMDLDKQYTEKEFLKFTQKLIYKTNKIHSSIEPLNNKKIDIPYSQEIIFQKNLIGYQVLAKSYPDFKYEKLSVKKSLLSTPLSFMGFSGYLNPFTNEAQVNYKVPIYTFPLICNHEMAHQIGYAAEGEANFIGFMATVRNPDVYIQYSGYSFALRYCLYYWKQHHPKLYLILKSQIRTGILSNFEENKQFWQKHETIITDGFEWFYDRFLKLNQQKDGIDGYSKFVDLMVNYETKYGTICN